MAYDVTKLLEMSQADIEKLFADSPPGPFPTARRKARPSSIRGR